MIKNVKLYPSIKKIENNDFDFSFINADFWNQDFYLEEKIDGSNVSFIKYNGQVYPFSRNQLINAQTFPTFDQFWNKWGNFISQNLEEGEVLNGEFIKQGRIKYVFDQETIPNLVLFDCGKLNHQWLDYIFNDTPMPNEKTRKIEFYPLEKLKSKFSQTPFKFPTITKVKIEPITSFNEKGFPVLSNLKILIDNNELLFNTQLEKYLEENYFKDHSLIFPKTDVFEGVILKSADGNFRLKNVFQKWKTFKQTPKAKPTQQHDPVFIDFIKNQLEERWEKFANFLYWGDYPNNPFKGEENIFLKVKNDPSLIPKIVQFKSWLYKDIIKELPETEKTFNEEYFETNKSTIEKIIANNLVNYIKNYQPTPSIKQQSFSKNR